MRRSEQTFFQRRHTDGQEVHEKMLNITNHQGNANQSHNEITLYLSEWLLSKRQERTSVSEDVKKMEPLCTVWGNINWCGHYREQRRFFKNVKDRIII